MQKKSPVFLMIYLFLFGSLVLSCNGDRRKFDNLLKKAENLLEIHPDSTLKFLDSIQNPYILSKGQHARYILCLVQAKDKCDKDITSDTLVFQSRDYFKETKRIKELALAEFYCGKVLQAKGNRDKAIEAYLEAGAIARKLDDKGLIGLSEFFCGQLNYEQHLFDEAIIYMKKASFNFSQTEGKYKNQVVSYNYIGNSFLIKQLPDSAFFYYNEGLFIAKQHNDSANQLNIKQNIGVAYLKLGDIQKAKKSLMDALTLSSGEPQKAKAYLNLAEVYFREGKKDSALLYSNLSLRFATNNTLSLVSVYRLLAKIEEKAGNYSQALTYYESYTKNLAQVLKEKENSNILDIQKRYDFELLTNANNELLIQRQWFVIGFILFLAITFFAFYYNRRENNMAMLIAEQQIFQLKEMVNKKAEISPKSDELRETLFRQLDIVKKISLMENYLKGEEKTKGKEVLKKINEIIYGQNDYNWDVFIEMANALYDNFLGHLRNSFSDLSETELLICCLSKIGMNNMEISLLLKTTQNAVQKRKSVIRQKTGMKEQESFVKQLDQLLHI